ncbi:11284_t:CDS:2, partial [Entrophospora sp. SA101]
FLLLLQHNGTSHNVHQILEKEGLLSSPINNTNDWQRYNKAGLFRATDSDFEKAIKTSS